MPYVAKSKTVKKRRVPVQARAIERVDKILNTAASLMANPEHKKVTTHLIAEKAGVSVGSVYQFFPNVESVKIALIERLLNQYYDHFSKILLAHPNIIDLKAFSTLMVSATHDFYQQQPDIVSHIVSSIGSQEFHDVNSRLNERIQKLMMNHFNKQNLGMGKNSIRRKISVAIAMGDMMTTLIWSTESLEERNAYLQDWKDIIGFYTAQTP